MKTRRKKNKATKEDDRKGEGVQRKKEESKRDGKQRNE